MPQVRRWSGLTVVFCLLLVVPWAPAAEPAVARKIPNFLIVLSDDHGIEYAGCYGNQTIRTPNIDRLARKGMRFTRAFTATAMCTPSRSMLYTGLFPHRNGAHPNHSATREGVTSLPSYLGKLGYCVGLAGKTHIKPKSVYPFEYMPRSEKAMQRFLRKSGQRPFCLIIATHHPHTPLVAPKPGEGHDPAALKLPPYLVDTPETRLRQRDYYNSVEILDRDLGDYLAMLGRLKLEDDTLVIYASDHGSQFPFGKWTLYDAGLRVPFIARWPGHVGPGTVTDAMISFVDVLPTLIELAGGKPPKDIDGRSFAGVLLGEKTSHREVIYGTHTSLGIISGSEYPIRAVRTGHYQYIRNFNHQGRFTNITTEGRGAAKKKKAGQGRGAKKPSGPGPLWRSWLELARTDPAAAARAKAYQRRPAEELYDVKSDPFELNNLADRPGLEPLKAELRRQLDAWMHQQGDPLAGK